MAGKKTNNRTQEKFSKFKNMPYFKEFDQKVRAGISASVIAKWLQNELCMFTDERLDSLGKSIYRYKESLPPGSITLAKPVYIEKAIEKMERGIDELEELESLYLLQKKRISIDAETESKINKLFSNTNREIALAKDLLKDRVELKMELGLLNRVAKKVDVSGGMVNVNQNLEPDMDDDKKQKLGIVAQKMLNVLVSQETE